jgi:hypothetical protein
MIYRHKEALIVSLGELKIISLIVVGVWDINCGHLIGIVLYNY